jgi:hypothetical protein
MKLAIYCIYYLGVIVWGTCLNYLDAFPAIVTTLLAPVFLLQIAEMSGRIRITSVTQEDDTSLINKSMALDLSDEEAAQKFGWAIINEMDECIKVTEAQLKEMVTSREEMAKMVKENK